MPALYTRAPAESCSRVCTAASKERPLQEARIARSCASSRPRRVSHARERESDVFFLGKHTPRAEREGEKSPVYIYPPAPLRLSRHVALLARKPATEIESAPLYLHCLTNRVKMTRGQPHAEEDDMCKWRRREADPSDYFFASKLPFQLCN